MESNKTTKEGTNIRESTKTSNYLTTKQRYHNKKTAKLIS